MKKKKLKEIVIKLTESELFNLLGYLDVYKARDMRIIIIKREEKE